MAAKNQRIYLFVIYLAIGFLVGCNQTTNTNKTKENTDVVKKNTDKPNPTISIKDIPWTLSADGKLSFRITTDKKVYSLDESVQLSGELRNNSKKPLIVSPLAYSFGTYGNALKITGPTKIKYNGPYKDFYAPPKEIPAGATIIDSVILSTKHWQGFNINGKYLIDCTYNSNSSSKQNIWSGKISCSCEFVKK